MPSAKKTPICGIHKVDQSVTARYNFVVEPGCQFTPSKAARPSLSLFTGVRGR
jgi:hypothetical protein